MHSRLRCIRSGRASGLDSRGKPGRYRINRGAKGFVVASGFIPRFLCSFDSRGKPGRYRINRGATGFGCSERVDPAISVMADFVGFAR